MAKNYFEIQAKNTIRWIEHMQENPLKIKKRNESLGSFKEGSVCLLGYGCEVLNVKHDSLDGDSMKLAELTGMFGPSGEPCGVLSDLDALTDINDYGGRGFKRMAKYMIKNVDHYFEPEVAVRIKQHFKNK